ncbi:MAG: MurT ligase domain-containing protein [Actinomycetota bacterium]
MTPALAIARAAGRISRGLGRGGGTSLPGKVLLRMRPGAVGELASSLPHGVALISATNGKTTTSRLVAGAVRCAGWRPVANPSGANLLSGVATALLENAGRAADIGLFEVDEAALPAVAAQARPRVILLMNLFRDQLDRYGELEAIAERWAAMIAALPPETRVVVNADDPAVCALARDRPGSVLFGLEDPAAALAELPHAADSTRCRRCSAELLYDHVFLGHLGHWRCPSCGDARPQPDVRAVAVGLDGMRGVDLELATPAGRIAARVGIPGVTAAYNAAAAAACALALGVEPEAVRRALQETRAAFGRGEWVELGGRRAVLLLAKNPTGANETIRTVLLEDGPVDLVMALNDRTADGHDVSWIWDVDVEPLVPRLGRLTLTGERAHDLALRFRYAGLDAARMTVEPDLDRALDHALAGGDRDRVLHVLPTYTAMLDLRALLVRRGAADHFWRDGAGA